MTITIDLKTLNPALLPALGELAEANRQLAVVQRRVDAALSRVLSLSGSAQPAEGSVPNVATPLSAEALGVSPTPPPPAPVYPLGAWDRPGDPPTAADRLGEDHYVIAREPRLAPGKTPEICSAPPMPTDLIDQAEAGALLGIKPKSVYNLVTRGALSVAEVRGNANWYRRADVLALAKSRPTPGAPAVIPAGAITRAEAAMRLGISPPTLVKHEQDGDIARVPGTGVRAGESTYYLATDVKALEKLRREKEAANKVAASRRVRAQHQTKKVGAPEETVPPLSFPAEKPAPPPSEGKPVRIVELDAPREIRPVLDQELLTNCVVDGKLDSPEGFWILWLPKGGGFEALDVCWGAGAQVKTLEAEGWIRYERWQRNGLGRWESTPANPGPVGSGNGVTRGAMVAGGPA